MGLCHCSRAKQGEDGQNRFRVINVNDDGKNVCPGLMELTESSLIFHIKRGGFVKWPYISLMKYGYDSDLFSFVCGRKCQTGEGIFGFKCKHAEELFGLLQTCMQSNGISVISDTERNTPVGASSALSSHRPELNRSELIPDPASTTSSECSTSADGKEVKRQHQSHLLLELKVSDGGMSQMSMHSYLDIDERRGIRPDQACMLRNMMESEEMETLGSIHSGDLNGVLLDTGYDSDDRREASCVRRMGYENVSAVPACDRSRRMLVTLSSSDSQGTSIIPAPVVTDCVPRRPSCPSIFQGQQNRSIMNEDSCPLHATKQWPSARSSITPQDCVPFYFNFDLGQSSQEAKTLNYIEVELESGCDSESPRTPQSPSCPVQWGAGQQSELYTELDLRKTTALSLIQRNQPQKDGTRRTRHNSKHIPA